MDTSSFNKDRRQSGIELLRILAACAVVILHYNNTQMGGAQLVMGGEKSYHGFVALPKLLRR